MAGREIVRFSARYGREFGVDPMVVLDDDGDETLMLMRAAFMEVVQRDKKEEEAKANRK